MPVERFSVTMDAELGRAVRTAADRAGVSVSRWISDAAADHLRNQLLGVALDLWEADQGPFTEAELDSAARAMRVRPRDDRAVS